MAEKGNETWEFLQIFCNQVKSKAKSAKRVKIIWSPLTRDTIEGAEASLIIPSPTTTGSGTTAGADTFPQIMCIIPTLELQVRGDTAYLEIYIQTRKALEQCNNVKVKCCHQAYEKRSFRPVSPFGACQDNT